MARYIINSDGPLVAALEDLFSKLHIADYPNLKEWLVEQEVDLDDEEEFSENSDSWLDARIAADNFKSMLINLGDKEFAEAVIEDFRNNFDIEEEDQ